MFDEGVAGCRPHRISEKRTPMTKSFLQMPPAMNTSLRLKPQTGAGATGNPAPTL